MAEGFSALLLLIGASLAPAAQAEFAQVVEKNHARWDLNSDGVVAAGELDAAIADHSNRGEVAAALTAMKRATRSKRIKVQPFTLPYLLKNSRMPPEAGGPDFNRMHKDGLAALSSVKSRELFTEGGPRLETVHQGRLGNCFCLAPIGALLAADPARVSAMFDRMSDGAYQVAFGPRKVRVVPPTDAELALTASNEGDGLWVNIYEKAVAEALNQSRPADQKSATPMDVLAKGGSASRTLEFITGRPIRRISFAFAKDKKTDAAVRDVQLAELSNQMESAAKDRRPMTCGTLAVTTPGLTPNHAYAIVGFDAQKKTVRLWNPHGGAFTPKGDPGLANGYPMKDGFFEMGLSEWTVQFEAMAYEVGP